MSKLDDALDLIQDQGVYELEGIDPETVAAAKQQIKDLMLALIPDGVDTDDYSYEDSAQDFMLGYIQACSEISKKVEAL